MFENLRIRAYLQTGVISDQYLPLEGILLYLKTRGKYESDRIETLPNQLNVKDPISDFRLPFESSRIQDKWVYHCSFAQWASPIAYDTQNYAKRFDVGLSDVIDFKQRRAAVNTIAGAHKNQFIKVYYRHAEYVQWFARSDKRELERLLPHLTNLGKKSSQGWGAVLRWEVTTVPDDLSLYDSNGNPNRSIPNPDSKQWYGYRAPFWLQENQTTCVLPST